MKKKPYVQPDVRVTALRVTNRLLAGSPLGNPSDYTNSGDPFGFGGPLGDPSDYEAAGTDPFGGSN